MKVLVKNTRLITLLILSVFTMPYFANSQVNMSIIVSFDQTPATATVIKAPLKYNKDFALSMQIDDGHESIFTLGYPIFVGGQVGNQTYPGLTYTDGCGNDIHFKISSAQFTFNGDGENGPDTHEPGSGYGMVYWPQMDTLYKAGWGIYNHGLNGNASVDNAFMNYSLKRNKSYTRKKLYNTTPGGVLTRMHVNPNGAIQWSQVAFDQGFDGALNQDKSSSFMGDHGGNVNLPSINWSNAQNLYRLHNNDVVVQNYVGDLADSSINGANYWGIIFTHSIGNEYPTDSFVADFTAIEGLYGSSGLDNILMSTDEEIIDYLVIRDTLTVSSNLVGSSLFISISGNVPDDLRFYALSLIVDADQNINNIIVTGADSTNHSAYGTNSGLINLFWDDEYIIPDEVLGDSMTTIASNTQQQWDAWIAMDYVTTMTNGNHKDSLRQVLCNIPGATFDAGFCDFIIDLGPDTTICQYDCDSILGPDGFNTYTWMVADTVYDTLQNIEVCPLDTTAYILLAENDFGVATDTIVYNVIDAPLVDLGADTSICQLDSITLYGPDTTGLDYTFEWIVADTLFDTTQNITVAPLDTTMYVLDVYSSSGCFSSDSININVLPLPLIQIIPSDTSYICLGDSLGFLVSGSGADTILWSTSDTTISIKVSPQQGDSLYTYYVDVSNNYGCSASDTSFLWIYDVPAVSFPYDTTTACSGQGVVLSAFVDQPLSVKHYIWHYYDIIDTTQSNTQFIIADTSATVYLQVITLNDCEVWDSVFVNVNQTAEITTGGNKSICKGDTATLEVFGAESYLWILGQDTISTDSVVKVFPVDTTQYYVIGEMLNGCSATDSVTVNILPSPNTSIVYNGTNPACQHSLISLIGEGADIYWWSTDETTDTIEFILEQEEFIELFGTSASNGCVSRDTLSIKMLPTEEVNFSGLLPAYCENDPASILLGVPAGGIYTGSGIIGNEFKPFLAGNGTHTIKYSYTNTNSCVGIDSSSTVVYGSGTVIDLGSDQTINPAEVIELDAGDGFDNYYWNTGSTFRNIIIHYGDNPPGSTLRYVVIGVINGCTSQGETNITFAGPDGIDNFRKPNFLLYPNPNTGTFTISYLDDVKEFELLIYDYYGKLIFSQTIECSPDCNAIIDLPGLTRGLYLIKTISEKGSSSGRIIVQ